MTQESTEYSAQQLVELDLFRRLSEDGRQLLLNVAGRMPMSSPVTLPERAGSYSVDQLFFMEHYNCATPAGKLGIELTLRAKLDSEGG